MATESEIQLCKKIIEDELGFYDDETEKKLLEMFQKIKEAETRGLSASEIVDEFLSEFSFPEANLIKAKILAYELTLSPEDQFRRGIYLVLDVFLTEEEKAKIEELIDSERFEELFLQRGMDVPPADKLSAFPKILDFWMKFHRIEQKQNKGNMEQQWEESEKILSWKEMQTGVYSYHGIEHRGTNDYDRPISVVILERDGVKKMFYAPASLYWNLKNRSETNFIKYEGTQTSEKGYVYPVFKFAV